MVCSVSYVHRQTDLLSDRQIDAQKDRQTCTGRHAQADMHRQTDGQTETGRQKHRHRDTDSDTGTEIDTLTHRHVDTHIYYIYYI